MRLARRVDILLLHPVNGYSQCAQFPLLTQDGQLTIWKGFRVVGTLAIDRSHHAWLRVVGMRGR